MSGACWKSPAGENWWRRDAGEKGMRDNEDRETGEILVIRAVRDLIEPCRQTKAGMPERAADGRVTTVSA